MALPFIIEQFSREERTPNITNNASIFTVGEGKNDAGGDVDYSNSVTEGLFTGVVGGRTIFDHKDNGVDYANWTIAGAGTTKGVNGIHLVIDSGNESAIIPLNLKPSTEYTIVYSISNSNADYTLSISGSSSAFDQVDISKENGLHKVKLTTKATITNNQIKFYFYAGTDGTAIDLELYAILEGDYTNDDSVNKPFKFGANSTNPDTRLQSIGKNLFDKNEIIKDTALLNTGEIKYASDNSSISNFIRVKPNTRYRLDAFLFVGEFDSNKKFILRGDTRNDIITSSNTYYLVLYKYLSVLSENIMLNEGDVALPYETYKKDTAYLSTPDGQPNRSLPNLTKDEFRDVGGAWEHIRKTDEDLDISSTDYDSIDTSTYVNVDVVKTTIFSTAKAGTTAIDGKTRYYDKDGVELIEITQASIDSTDSVGKYYFHTDGTIWIIVADGTYADIETARTGLGTTSLIYELSTPIITQLPKIPPLQTFENGTIIIDPYYHPDTPLIYTTASGGLSWSIPVSEIDKIEGIDGEEYTEISSDRYTLATDGLSVRIYTDNTKIVEVADSTVWNIFAPVRLEESTIPEITATYAINKLASDSNLNSRALSNSRQIDDLYNQVALLIVLNS